MFFFHNQDKLIILAGIVALVLVGYVIYLVAQPGQQMNLGEFQKAALSGTTTTTDGGNAVQPIPVPSRPDQPTTKAASDFAVQSSEPAVMTTQPPPGPNPPASITDQPKQAPVFYPMPAEHPYDPKYPKPFPNPHYKAPPPGGQPITNPPVSGMPSGTKPPYTESPFIPTPRPDDKDTSSPYDAPVPTTLAPTITNQYNIVSTSVTDEPLQCPVMPPKGKLELAIKAWTNGKTKGPVYFEDGDVDMGRDGGWWDGDGSGCCDHYCRRVGPKGGEYWSCITPQAPYNEFTHMRPKGHQCSMFAGPPISKPIN